MGTNRFRRDRRATWVLRDAPYEPMQHHNFPRPQFTEALSEIKSASPVAYLAGTGVPADGPIRVVCRATICQP